MKAALLLIAIIVTGMLYEKVGEFKDRRRYAQIGRSVNIGGRTLNIYCSGEGTPTVVFEGAGHTAGFAWAGMQATVAKFTRSCWYDRAGYGWSDPGPSPRTFQAIASDLHSLLQAASVSPPYVLVGATAGAFHVRVYTGLYPRDVAGAVLIDASDPDVFAREPSYMKGDLASLPPFVRRLACTVVGPALLRIGVVRLLGNPGAGRPFELATLEPDQQQKLIFLSNNPTTVLTEGEGCQLDESMTQVRVAGNFGNRPLYVLAGSTPFGAARSQYADSTASLDHYWFQELQPRLAALSTRGHLMVEGHADTPEAIIEGIRSVVTQVRQDHHRK